MFGGMRRAGLHCFTVRCDVSARWIWTDWKRFVCQLGLLVVFHRDVSMCHYTCFLFPQLNQPNWIRFLYKHLIGPTFWVVALLNVSDRRDEPWWYWGELVPDKQMKGLNPVVVKMFPGMGRAGWILFFLPLLSLLNGMPVSGKAGWAYCDYTMSHY